MELKLPEKWKRVKERYSLTNDQKLKNLDNLIAPCGATVSVFIVEEEPKVGSYMFDKMIRDYKQITPNLYLLMAAKIKLKNGISTDIYIIREKISKKAIVQLFLEMDEKLFALIFNLDVYERSLKKNIEKNPVFGEVINLLETWQ